MNIPFIEKIGIEAKDNGSLYLPYNYKLLNHLGTIHASAQFTLAETQSGFFLELMFPQYSKGVIPMLRSSTVNYKKPATKDIYSVASASKEELEKFEKVFLKKGRGIINDIMTMRGEFSWFISKI